MKLLASTSIIAMLLAASFGNNGSARAQTAPRIEWQRTLGGSSREQAYGIIPVPDGGYLFTGFSNSNDGDFKDHHGATTWRDAVVGKLDSNGTVQWVKSLGGSAEDIAICAALTADGGYLIGGSARSNDGDVSGHHGTTSTADCWIVKLDANGKLLWQKSLGGSGDDGIARMIATNDGGFLIAARCNSNDGDVTSGHRGSLSNSDFWVVKIDSVGKILWQKTLGGTGVDAPFGLTRTDDSAYVLAGYSNSNDGDVSGNHGSYDIWVVKIDSVGNIIWQKSLGSPGHDDMNSVTLTTDGGYIVGGSSYYSGGDITTPHYGHNDEYDIWIVKLSREGNLVWQKSLGGTGRDYEQDVHATPDGGLLCSGYTTSNDIDVSGHHGDTTGYDGWVVKLDSMGKIEWQKSIGGTKMEGATGIALSRDGGCVLACNSQSSDGDLTTNHGAQDCWIVKLAPPSLVSAVPTAYTMTDAFTLFPNPTSATAWLHITGGDLSGYSSLEIIDMLGRIHQRTQLAARGDDIVIDTDELPCGVYFVRLIDVIGKTKAQHLLQVMP